MVKGVSRRVVVVRPEEHGLFEQAIFLVRDSTAPRRDIVREACRVANGYLAGRKARRCYSARQLTAAGAAGALTASAVWAIAVLVL